MRCQNRIPQNVLLLVGKYLPALLFSLLHLGVPRLIAQESRINVQQSSAEIARLATDEDVKEIIKLASAGFSDQLVIQQIKSEGKVLLFSADQRNLMLRQGIAGEVVAALGTSSNIDFAAKPANTVAPTLASQAADTLGSLPLRESSVTPASTVVPTRGQQHTCPTEAGAYYQDAGAWKPMDSIHAIGFKSTGMMKAVISYGAASMRMKAQFRGPESPYQLAGASLEICLVGLTDNGRDVTVLKLEKEKDRRELQMATLREWSGINAQVDPHKVVQVETTKVADKVYLVSSKGAIPEGEFILFVIVPDLASMARANTPQSLTGYDFGFH